MMHPSRIALPFVVALGLLLLAPSIKAWSPEGHQVVGQLALRQLTPAARGTLEDIVGTRDAATIARACNWPDDYRATPEGAWSAPDHYINVPRDEPGYDPERDCAGGKCVAGAIERYAKELACSDLACKRRWQAWARVCHFVGDIHQPMHVGYVHDRGGNDFDVVFHGQEMDLHEYWDHALIGSNYPDWRQLVTDLSTAMDDPLPARWEPEQAQAWAIESHRLARQYGYPAVPQITPEFAAHSWLLARQQLALAGRRLAQLLNTVLTQAE
jgi:hypothetical protein